MINRYKKTIWVDKLTPINQANLNKIEQQLENITDEVINEKTFIEQNKANISTNTTEINTIKNKVSENENRINATVTEVNTLKAKIQEDSTKVSTLTNATEMLNNKIVVNTANINTNTTRINSLQDRINEAGEELNAVRQSVRIIQQEVDGNEHATNEAINTIQSTLNEVVTKINEDEVSIKKYESLKEGDDWTNALKEALNNHNQIYFPEGTYKLGEVSIGSNKTIRGAGDRTVIIPLERIVFKIKGSIGNEHRLIEDITSPYNSVLIDAENNFEAGQYVLIKSLTDALNRKDATEEWCLGYSTPSSQGAYFGEFLEIKEKHDLGILDGIDTSMIDFTNSTLFPMYKANRTSETSQQTRDNSTIANVTFKRNVKIKDLKIQGKCTYAIWANYCKDVVIDNVTNIVNNYDAEVDKGISLAYFYLCLDCEVVNCRFEKNDNVVPKQHHYINVIKFVSSQGCGVRNTTLKGTTQAVDFTYNAGDIVSSNGYIKDCKIINSSQGITTHGGTYKINITGNEIRGGAQGISCRSKSSIISNNNLNGEILEDNELRYGIGLYEGHATNCVISNNTIKGYCRGIGVCDGADAGETFFLANAQITNNTIHDCERAFVIHLSSNGYKYKNKNIMISNNNVILSDRSTHIIRIPEGVTGVYFNNNIFDNKNTIETANGIWCDYNVFTIKSHNNIFRGFTTAHFIRGINDTNTIPEQQRYVDIANNYYAGVTNKIKFGSNIKNKYNINDLTAEDSLNVIYVDANNGNDNNDGTSTNPVRTARKAFEILCNLGSKALFKQWKIKFAAGTYTSVRVQNIPQFSKHLLIEGTRDDEGNITSIFKYEQNSNNYIGIWLEPMRGVSVQVTDLKFVGYKKGFNGYGILVKNHGYLHVISCEAEDCDCGFAGINNSTLIAWKTIARNCSYGFRVQYCSSATIGAGTDGAHMADGGNGCEVDNCKVGFLVTRNSVAHSDYVKYFRCTEAGVKADMNARVATLSNVFTDCRVGVKLEGGAEWIAGTVAQSFGQVNEIDTWIQNNTLVDKIINENGEEIEKVVVMIPYTMKGNSRYNRVQSQHCKTESLFMCVTSKNINPSKVTGHTNKTEVYRAGSVHYIPNYYLDGDLVKVRIVIRGTHKNPSAKTGIISTMLRGLDHVLDQETKKYKYVINGQDISLGDASLPVRSDTAGGFKVEHDLVFTKDEFQRAIDVTTSATTGGDRVVTLDYVPSVKPSTAGLKQLMVHVTPGDATSEIVIKRIEMYITN